ncbi:MAG: phage holin family protein [Acidimicrobiia bacterium]|nr:phage holin family protein [Acidimicrobiia bacterium]
MSTIVKIGATAAGLYAATWLLDGLEFEGGFGGLLLVSVLIVVVNLFVRPIIKLLSFPVILITLGLFTLVINALMLQIVVWLSEPERFGLGLSSDGFFWSTFLGAIIIAIVRTVIENVFDD